MLIRRDRPKGKHLDPGRLSSSNGLNDIDITYVEDKFPKLKQVPWLARRLGQAIGHRRQFIRYRQEHRAKLKAAIEHSNPHADMQTLATSFEEADDNDGRDVTSIVEQETESKDNHEENRSLFTTGTSFMTADNEISDLRVPDLSDMVLDGVRLDYGEHIECPYCRTIQCPANRHEWKYVFWNLSMR